MSNVNRMSAAELDAKLGVWDVPGGLRRNRLADAISELVDDGRILGGTVLPSERQLAARLDISRGTVSAAYAELRVRRLVETWHGHGTVARRDVALSPSGAAFVDQVAASVSHVFDTTASVPADSIDLRASMLSDPPKPPVGALDRARRRLVESWSAPHVQAQGLPSLRDVVAEQLTSDGLPTTPDQIVITSGGQQALVLVTQLILRPNDLVFTEEVTYAGMLDALRAVRVLPVGLPFDAPGIDLVALRRGLARRTPALLYLNPSAHNPTGVTMPGPARALLAEALAPTDTIVVDDTSQAHLQWEGQTPKPLAHYAEGDAARRHITVGSLSKVSWAGLRVGWIRCDAALVPALLRLRLTADLMSSVPSQLIAEELLRSGLPQAETVTALRERGRRLSERLATAVPDWTWRPPSGGLNLWIDTHCDDPERFFDAARAKGVLLVRSSAHRPDGQQTSHFRFPLGLRESDLEDAVDRLGAAWEAYLAGAEHS